MKAAPCRVPGGFARLDNGLTEDENLLLATTQRPADIAALVALGLDRRARSNAVSGEGRDATSAAPPRPPP